MNGAIAEVTSRIASLTSIGRTRTADDARLERHGPTVELDAKISEAAAELRKTAAKLERLVD